MCPSYRATGEEQHSTRGRARLLHEMLAGGPVADGWRSPEVREALDLCLGCKGCRSDCPAGVDMATYKAEFLHHYHPGWVRPVSHYTMGGLPSWLRVLAPAAPLLNAAARVPPLAAPAKWAAGVARQRRIPRLARRTLLARTRERPPVESPQAYLWPDTFTHHFDPQVGEAALRVMDAAGLRVALPPGPRVCCGLTYVSTGRLDRARHVMRRTLDRLEPVAGRPLVVLEPSCAATLRTDLPELLPGDARARAVAASVRAFAQTLEELAPDWEPPRLDRPVAGQTHCHQHAVLGDAAERRLRERARPGRELSGGCCGLAGNFGFRTRPLRRVRGLRAGPAAARGVRRAPRRRAAGGRLLLPHAAGGARGPARPPPRGAAGGGAAGRGRTVPAPETGERVP